MSSSALPVMMNKPVNGLLRFVRRWLVNHLLRFFRQGLVNHLLAGLLLLVMSNIALAKPLDIAHRGYADMQPESTLQAFEYAIAVGADGLELDVRQTRDGVLVVHHDRAVAELNSRTVESLSLDEILQNTQIPMLEEVVSLAKSVNKPLWIEIKQSHLYPGIIQRTLALLSRYQYQHQSVIQSFNHADLAAIKQSGSNIELLALFSRSFSVAQVPAYVRYVGLPAVAQYQQAALVQAIHRAGKQVIFWRRDANSERRAVIESFIALGADGFMLNKPLSEILK